MILCTRCGALVRNELNQSRFLLKDYRTLVISEPRNLNTVVAFLRKSVLAKEKLVQLMASLSKRIFYHLLTT